MIPEERNLSSIFLCWNLQKGIDHKALKLPNCQILINNQFHGKVTDFKFTKSSSNSSAASTTSASTTLDSMEQQASQYNYITNSIMCLKNKSNSISYMSINYNKLSKHLSKKDFHCY